MKRNRKTFLWIILVLLCAGLFYAYHSYQEYLRIEAQRHAEAMAALSALIEDNSLKAQSIHHSYTDFQSAEYEKENDPAYREETVGVYDLYLDAVGDSVMLGAASLLKETFPNAYVDAAVNRAYYPLLQIVSERYEKKILGDPVVIGIGTNGPLNVNVCHQVLDLCKERDVFWITTSNNYQFYNTDTILSFAKDYDNVTIIDWDTYSRDHPEYFYRDGIHLPPAGREAYVTLIKDTITETLWNEMPHEKNRILIAGDGSLLTCTDLFDETDENLDVCIEENMDITLLNQRIENLKEEHILTERIILCTKDAELAETWMNSDETAEGDTEISCVFLKTDKETEMKESENMYVLDLSEESNDIYAEDQIHFNEEISAKIASYLLTLVHD